MTLEDLVAAVEALPKAQTTWNGEVRLESQLLPYQGKDPKTGEPCTIHAVIVNRVLLVSQAAWDALKARGGAG